MENKILIETSARHIHLTAEAVEILYGKGAELTVKKELSQPGQYAAGNEKITLVGPTAKPSQLAFSAPHAPLTKLNFPSPMLAYSVSRTFPFARAVTLQTPPASRW